MGVHIIRILLFRVLYSGLLFSETPIWGKGNLNPKFLDVLNPARRAPRTNTGTTTTWSEDATLNTKRSRVQYGGLSLLWTTLLSFIIFDIMIRSGIYYITTIHFSS